MGIEMGGNGRATTMSRGTMTIASGGALRPSGLLFSPTLRAWHVLSQGKACGVDLSISTGTS
jgi:hypothetical protein